MMALCYTKIEDKKSAIQHKEKALVIYENCKLSFGYSGVDSFYHISAYLSFESQEFSTAIQFNLKALKIREKLPISANYNIKLAETFVNLSLCYFYIKNGTNALIYCKRAVKIFEKVFATCNHPYIIEGYINLGASYELTGEYNNAIECYNKVQRIVNKTNHSQIINRLECLKKICIQSKIIEQFKSVKLKTQKSDNDIEIEFKLNASIETVKKYCKDQLNIDASDVLLADGVFNITISPEAKATLRVE